MGWARTAETGGFRAPPPRAAVQSCNLMVRIGDTRGGCWDGEQEREGECREEGGAERERERERDPTMASRGACQRQLKPPGGTTRSNIGVVERWLTSSCCTRPNWGRADAPWGWGSMVPPAEWYGQRAACGEPPELQHSPAAVWWHLGIHFARTGEGGVTSLRRTEGRWVPDVLGGAGQPPPPSTLHPPPSIHRPRTLARIRATDMRRSMCPHVGAC